jgi:putative peptidoglycan lipid II flippase
MAIWQSIAKVGTATIVSRILGFVRDAMIAGTLGGGAVADAFVVAFRLPNLLRRLFAEGVFSAAFVPLYSRTLADEGEEGAARFAGEIASGLIAIMLVTLGVAMLFAPVLVGAMAFGFANDKAKFDLTVVLTRICLPYLGSMSLIGLLGGVLAAHRRYLAAAIAPVVLNIVLIAALVVVEAFGYVRSVEAGYILSIGVAIAGLAQLVLVALAVWRAGIGLAFRWPTFTASIRRLMTSSVPVVVGGGITQINILVGTAIASMQAGAVASLYYADRVYQLPLGVIGIAIGVVLLPELLHRIRIGREDLAIDTQNRSLEMALALTVPAAVGLFAAAHPILEVLFERGAFGPRDTALTAAALRGFAVGLPAFVMIKIFSAALFARHDLKSPMWAGIVAFIVNVALSIALFARMGGAGIAVATSVAGWINAGMLWVVLSRGKHWRIDGGFETRVPKLLIAAAAMGAVTWVLREMLDPVLGAENALLVKTGALLALVGAGVIVYAGLGILLGGASPSAIREAFRRDETLPSDPLLSVVSGD